MTPTVRVLSLIPGMVPRAPKRNAVVACVYLLLLGVVLL